MSGPEEVVIGLDLGSTSGWAALSLARERIDGGQWSLGKGPPASRYIALRLSVLALLDRFDGWIRAVAIETPTVARQSTQARRLGYGFLATAELVVARRGLTLVECNNTQTKVALSGHGRASKAEQISAVQRRWSVRVGEHEADALGVALAGLGGLEAAA